jgi:hypothetical protein
MEKLYVITRSDLPDGDQAVQSIHAALAYAAEHPDWMDWYRNSNYIAMLAVRDEREL